MLQVFRCFRCLGLMVLVFRCLGFRCSGFRCSGFRVNDILEGQKGDQGGSPKMAKIQYGVKPDICKRAAQKRPKINTSCWPLFLLTPFPVGPFSFWHLFLWAFLFGLVQEILKQLRPKNKSDFEQPRKEKRRKMKKRRKTKKMMK